MPLLTCTNIEHRYGNDIILEGVSLSIEPGRRVGIVGRNGCGKSTLLKILAGITEPYAGSVTLQRGCRAGYLKQDPDLNPEDTLFAAAEGAFEHLHKLHAELDSIYEAMATAQGAELDRLMDRQSEVDAQMQAAGGYAVEHKIGEILHGLGFIDSQFTLKVKQLSGGQRGRLALAKLLLENPDVLLLDEPTNHLDIEGRIWLEQFLTNEYEGAVLMVSHDRYLLDAVVKEIVEVEGGRLIDYPGNYAKFRELRVERRTVMLRAYEAQQSKFEKEEEYIRRFKAGQRARQAKGRESRLDREKAERKLERPMELDVFSLQLPKAERSGDIVATIREANKKYKAEDGTDKVLFQNLSISIKRGERWGIIGPNGAGKSTLVKCLMGEANVDSGEARLGASLKIGYYRQTHENIDMDQTVVRYLQGVIPKENPTKALSEQQARDLAGAFLFSGDEQGRLMGVMSGGERSRAVIAGLLASAKNLIILDEPTNHLDIPSAERLEEALRSDNGFDGTMLLISHDRALLNATCQNLIVLDGKGNAEVFYGTYNDWAAREAAQKKQRQADEAAAKDRQASADKAKRADDDRKKQAQASKSPAKPVAATQPADAKLAKLKTDQIEKRIEELQNRIKKIDEEISNGDWRDTKKMTQLGDDRTKAAKELEPLEFEWMRRAEAEQV